MENNTQTQDKLIEKIKKLLALAGSSNENEAGSAMLKAQELMAKHSIEMHQIDDITDEKEVVTNMLDEFVSSPWKLQLATIMANNFKCKIYLQKFHGKRGTRITFLGLKEDVEICAMMYQFSVKIVNRGRDTMWHKAYFQGIPTKGVQGDYTVGFLSGLKEKFEEQKRANQEWGLVLVCDKAVTDQFESLNLTVNKSKSTIKTSHNEEAKAMGFTDGKNFGVGKELA